MTDSDDKIARRYRNLAREEPPAALDRAILERARARVPARPRHRWVGPVSIAAVLVLGVGIALRMQLEQPGIETSAPETRPPVPVAEPVPAARKAATPEARSDAPAPAPKAAAAKRQEAPAPKPFANQTAPLPRPPQAEAPPAPLDRVPAPTSGAAAPAAPPAAAARAPAAAAESSQAAPQRAKREGGAADSLGASALGKVVSPEAQRDRELERIATLRAADRHAEADKALEEFRRRYPDFRIPEATWERVRPR